MTEKIMGDLYLEPEEKILKNEKKVAQDSKKSEKQLFCVKYEADEKPVVLSEIEKLDCEILEQSDSKNYVTVKVSMSQLAAIKSLNCIEKVELADESLMIERKTNYFDADIDIDEARKYTEHVSLL